MRILVCNDDGYMADGIGYLAEIARTLSDDVWVVAPMNDQSAVSHSLTVRKPLRMKKVGPQHYAVQGTPTDCILMALNNIMKDHQPDLVLSGINNGANLAEDVIYSGTISAARQATLFGIRSIALSLTIENGKPKQWATADTYAKKLIERLLGFTWVPGTLMNVNFPNIPPHEVKGARLTMMGQREMIEGIIERQDPHGEPYYWIGSGPERYQDIWKYAKPGCDIEAIAEKYISVSPIKFNMTDEKFLNKMKSEFDNV